MKEIFNSIKTAPYQSLASFFILFLTLFLSLLFFNLISFFYAILSYVETKPQVAVYFQTQTQEKDIFKIRQTLTNSRKVTSIKYISKAEALKIYRELNKDNPLLLEMVSADILPASLEINAKKPEYLAEIAEYLKKQAGVDEVQFQKSIVERLLTLNNVLRKVFLFLFVFLIVISSAVLMTTTAFKIALKKEEIELLRLLGASKFYVRKPYLIEGIFFGFLGDSSAWIVFYLIFFYLQPFLNSYLFGLPQLPFFQAASYHLYVWPPSVQYIGLTYLLTALSGILIGFIGNYLSTSKYIK
jgi:cell division transport system permease protein